MSESKGEPKEANERATITGQVVRSFFSSPTFSAGIIANKDGTQVTFSIKGQVAAGETVTLVGAYGMHPKYGRQFQAESLLLEMPTDAEGLANFLSNDPAARGIGPVKARKIAQHYGADFEKVLLSNPAQISNLFGIKMADLESLSGSWQKNKEYNAISIWLSSYGLTHNQVKSIVDKLGNNAKATLENNPYLLIGQINGFGFKRVDAIGLKMGVGKRNENRIRAGLVYCVQEKLDNGDTLMDADELKRTAVELLAIDSLDAPGLIADHLNDLELSAQLVRTQQDGRALVALPWIDKAERELVEFFSSPKSEHPERKLFDVAVKFCGEACAKLNTEQYAAVVAAFAKRVSLITGGAGVGKTYTIAEIVRLAWEAGLHVMLCAPTGKAAMRVNETVTKETGFNPQARTIHRALEYQPGFGFRLNKQIPIYADLVIVDESSMIDVPLFHSLVQAIGPHTHLVLVGDPDQLPPVGPGNVLRDLINRRGIHTTKLTAVVRQAGVLKHRSIEILSGTVGASAQDGEEVPKGQQTKWIVADKFNEAKAAQQFIATLYKETLPTKLGYTGAGLISNVQLLTPTHKGPLGTIELNAMVQRIVQQTVYGVEIPPGDAEKIKLYRGDKILWTKNDYDLCIMNGTVGYVNDIGAKGQIELLIDGEAVEIPPEKKSNIALAYAMTIHKSQGSEFPCTIVVCHKSHSFQHHRNLLYTGVTRARRELVLVGDSYGVKNCAAKKQVDARLTLMAYILPPVSASTNPPSKPESNE